MALCLHCCLCVCAFFLLLVHHFICAVVPISYGVADTPNRQPADFVAPGASTLGTWASHPLKPFWNLKLDDSALWNHLQHVLDREHNPLLRQRTTVEAESRKGPGCRSQRLDSGWKDQTDFSLEIQEFVQSMHCREYTLIMDQPRPCGNNSQEAPMLLIVIKSVECNFENRQAIRKTWGQDGWVNGETGKGGEVRRVFLIGRQDQNRCDRSKNLLELEGTVYRDILWWDFRDTFFNLTLKDVLFWPWFMKRCPRAHFIFKGDDDVFVRTPALLDFLRQEEQQSEDTAGILDFVIGNLNENAFPIRRKSTKYYIPESFYMGQYPPYLSGGGVVYSGSLAMRLNEVSKRVHLFPIDDVYLGMCLRKLGLAPKNHPGFLTFGFPKEKANKRCAYFSILLVHKRSPEEILHLWEELQTQRAYCLNQTQVIT